MFCGVLQPKKCIICGARKAATSSGYEELVKCLTKIGKAHPSTADMSHSQENQDQRALLSQVLPKRHNKRTW